jgi:hypothetical protein
MAGTVAAAALRFESCSASADKFARSLVFGADDETCAALADCFDETAEFTWLADWLSRTSTFGLIFKKGSSVPV